MTYAPAKVSAVTCAERGHKHDSNTTTGLPLLRSRDVRKDYPDWHEIGHGHCIDAPEFITSGVIAFAESCNRPITHFVYRESAF